MARLFLTNIDLNTNELQNAVIQNLSSAPTTGNKEGRIYYDVTAKALYLYTNGAWKPLASGGAAASSLELTGDVTGTANVDPATGKITLDTTVVNNSVALGDDTTGDYVQQVHGTANQISVDYESGEGVTATVSLPSTIVVSNLNIGDGNSSINIASGDITLNPDSGYVYFGEQLRVAGNNGNIETDSIDLNLLPGTGIVNIGTGFGELHLQKTEYSRDGSLQGVIAAQSDGSLRVTAIGELQLESNNGDIKLNSSTGNTYFNNAIRIDSEGQVTATNGDLALTADSGNVVINSTAVVDNIQAKNNGSNTLTISGGNSSVTLDGDTGNVNINPDGILHVYGDTTFENNVTVTGNLNVEGTLNAVNRTEINIEDNTIRLNTGFTGSPTADAGIIVERGTANDTAIIWSETNDQWTLTNDGSNYYAIARKYVEVIGDASNTSFDVVHNLGTRDITVMVRENNAEYNVVETDILMKDGNTVTIGFTDAPALNSYKVIIVG